MAYIQNFPVMIVLLAAPPAPMLNCAFGVELPIPNSHAVFLSETSVPLLINWLDDVIPLLPPLMPPNIDGLTNKKYIIVIFNAVVVAIMAQIISIVFFMAISNIRSLPSARLSRTENKFLNRLLLFLLCFLWLLPEE